MTERGAPLVPRWTVCVCHLPCHGRAAHCSRLQGRRHQAPTLWLRPSSARQPLSPSAESTMGAVFSAEKYGSRPLWSQRRLVGRHGSAVTVDQGVVACSPSW